MLRRLTFVIAALNLLGCGMPVETNVQGISMIPDDISPKTVYIIPFSKADANSLGWQKNRQILADVLAKKGFETVGKKGQASLVAYMGAAVDGGEKVTSVYSIPQYGVTGYSGASTYGSTFGNTYSSTTTLNPTYGVTGYSTGSRTDTVFTRVARVDMIDRRTGKMMFEGQATSTGWCHAFEPIAPYIFASLLQEFPKGKTGKVRLELEDGFEC